LDGESKCVVSATPLLNGEQAPLFYSLVVRIIRPAAGAGWKDGLSTLPVNERNFVNTIDAIIEDATGWQGSVHGILAFHLFALVLSSFVPGASLIRDNEEGSQ
jgi:hypothetical protein